MCSREYWSCIRKYKQHSYIHMLGWLNAAIQDWCRHVDLYLQLSRKSQIVWLVSVRQLNWIMPLGYAGDPKLVQWDVYSYLQEVGFKRDYPFLCHFYSSMGKCMHPWASVPRKFKTGLTDSAGPAPWLWWSVLKLRSQAQPHQTSVARGASGTGAKSTGTMHERNTHLVSSMKRFCLNPVLQW
jgi:hypothetical protein